MPPDMRLTFLAVGMTGTIGFLGQALADRRNLRWRLAAIGCAAMVLLAVFTP